MNRTLNWDLLPTSGIRAGLSAITPAAFLPIPGILLASPLPDCSISLPVESHAMHALLHLPEFILCVHAIPNPNPELLSYSSVAFSSWWAATCCVVKAGILC